MFKSNKMKLKFDLSAENTHFLFQTLELAVKNYWSLTDHIKLLFNNKLLVIF